jgi:dienelactone hydrolase
MLAILLAAGMLVSPTSFQSLDYGLPIPAMLFEPAAIPAPAVLVLHGCSGVDRDVLDWARWLAENGYIALVPDSFTPRRIAPGCSGSGVSPTTRALDAYGALSFLRTRTDVDAAHVGEIGFADGGATILSTQAQVSAHPAFAAAVAFAPDTCAQHPATKLAFPLMLMGGGDWTDAKTCTDYLASIDPAHSLSSIYTDATILDARTRVLAFLRRYL